MSLGQLQWQEKKISQKVISKTIIKEILKCTPVVIINMIVSYIPPIYHFLTINNNEIYKIMRKNYRIQIIDRDIYITNKVVQKKIYDYNKDKKTINDNNHVSYNINRYVKSLKYLITAKPDIPKYNILINEQCVLEKIHKQYIHNKYMITGYKLYNDILYLECDITDTTSYQIFEYDLKTHAIEKSHKFLSFDERFIATPEHEFFVNDAYIFIIGFAYSENSASLQKYDKITKHVTYITIPRTDIVHISNKYIYFKYANSLDAHDINTMNMIFNISYEALTEYHYDGSIMYTRDDKQYNFFMLP